MQCCFTLARAERQICTKQQATASPCASHRWRPAPPNLQKLEVWTLSLWHDKLYKGNAMIRRIKFGTRRANCPRRASPPTESYAARAASSFAPASFKHAVYSWKCVLRGGQHFWFSRKARRRGACLSSRAILVKWTARKFTIHARLEVLSNLHTQFGPTFLANAHAEHREQAFVNNSRRTGTPGHRKDLAVSSRKMGRIQLHRAVCDLFCWSPPRF